MTLRWEELSQEFEPDGALRDIYVLNVDLGAWEKALLFLTSRGGLRFEVDGAPAPLPRSADAALSLRPTSNPLLAVTRDGIEYACHFFDSEEVELDFQPSAVHEPRGLAALGQFVLQLGQATARNVVVTHENEREREIFRYSVANDVLQAARRAG